jgi:hypothetical protein
MENPPRSFAVEFVFLDLLDFGLVLGELSFSGLEFHLAVVGYCLRSLWVRLNWEAIVESSRLI